MNLMATDSLGDFILNKLGELDMTQADLQRVSGVSGAEVSRIISGKRKQPSQTTLRRLAHPLRVPPADLYRLAGYHVEDYPDGSRETPPPYGDHRARGEEAYPARAMRTRIDLPLLGEVPAGPADLAEEYVEDYLPVDPAMVADDPLGYYWLRIRGKSMSMDGITDKGKILVHRQEDVDDYQVAVVRIDNTEATVKRVKHLNGKLQLIPAHPSMEVQEIDADRVRIIGRVKLAQTEF